MAFAAIALAVIAELLVFEKTAAGIVAIWWRSETYTHGFLVIPIAIWLMWRDRQVLQRIAPRPDPWALLPLALVGFGWLLGEFASVNTVKQLALVGMLPVTFWLLAGRVLARAWIFPLAFTLLSVPVGDFMVPTLMSHTADATVWLLQRTGIPVYREGLDFMLPSGHWSVAEACSGIRYLIASFTLGCLGAYLMYRGLWRRLAFVSASILLPIIANWLRAYMIVMIGHLSGMTLAVGVDHIIYGWLFFGLVMLLLFWIGGFWREDGDAASPSAEGRATARGSRLDGGPPRRQAVALGLFALLSLAVTAMWPVYGAWSTGATGPAAVGGLRLAALPAGWQRGEPFTGWTPGFQHYTHSLQSFFLDARGRPLGLSVMLYADQTPESELISWGNTLVGQKRDHGRLLAHGGATVSTAGGPARVNLARVSTDRDELAVAYVYWVDGRYTSSRLTAKLLALRSRLLAQSDAGALVAVYAPDPPDGSGGRVAEDALAAMLPALSRELDAAIGLKHE